MPTEPVLDGLVRLYTASAGQFVGPARDVALSLFVVLASLQLTWDLVMWVVLDRRNAVGLLLRKFFLLSFFYTLIGAIPLWLPRILAGFEALGQRVTGLDGLSPSSIFTQGVSLAVTVFDSLKDVLITVFVPFAGTFRVVTFFCVLIAFTVIAFQLARVLVEAALVLGGLVVFLAGAGHKMTFGLFEGYVRYALDVGIRVFVVYLLVAVGADLAQTWDVMMQEATVLELADPRFHLSIPAGAGLFALLVWTLPKTISQRLAESLSFAGHNPLSDRG